MITEITTEPALTVSQLNTLARELLEQNLVNLWVSGEVSNLTKASSGHYYFLLKDQYAQVRCALFRQRATQLNIQLKEGDEITLNGKISLYEPRGEFQITVSEVRFNGIGSLYEAYERLKNQLQAQGLFDTKNKRSIPPYPKQVGVITSLAAAALHDVVSTIKRRNPAIRIIIYPTAVQGKGSEQHIAQAIQVASARQEVDVLIICRGGGSIEDLWAFNEECVVRAIADCTIPVVSGVGHETDFTLTDFAADVRAPTPTGAAEMVVADQAIMHQKIKQYNQLLQSTMIQKYQNVAQKLDWLSRNLIQPKQLYTEYQKQLHSYSKQLHTHFTHTLQQKQLNCQNYMRILQQQKLHLPHFQQQLAHPAQHLQVAWQNYLTQKFATLDMLQQLLQAISPKQVLSRGFSVVTNQHGKIIRHPQQLRVGQKLRIHFMEGATDVRVEQDTPQSDLFD